MIIVKTKEDNMYKLLSGIPGNNNNHTHAA